jgi:sulfotransferase family protein
VIDSHKMQGKDYAHIWDDGMGDFIKTHDAFKAVPNVIYLLRNPYDTLKSYYHFERQLGNQQSIGAFLEMRIPEWVRHVKSWLIDNKNPTQSIYLIEYEELSPKTFYALALRLGFEWDANYAFGYANQQAMRNEEQWFAQHNPVYRRFELEFVRKGSVREVEGFETYRELIKKRTQETYCAITSLKV